MKVTFFVALACLYVLVARADEDANQRHEDHSSDRINRHLHHGMKYSRDSKRSDRRQSLEGHNNKHGGHLDGQRHHQQHEFHNGERHGQPSAAHLSRHGDYESSEPNSTVTYVTGKPTGSISHIIEVFPPSVTSIPVKNTSAIETESETSGLGIKGVEQGLAEAVSEVNARLDCVRQLITNVTSFLSETIKSGPFASREIRMMIDNITLYEINLGLVPTCPGREGARPSAVLGPISAMINFVTSGFNCFTQIVQNATDVMEGVIRKFPSVDHEIQCVVNGKIVYDVIINLQGRICARPKPILLPAPSVTPLYQDRRHWHPKLLRKNDLVDAEAADLV